MNNKTKILLGLALSLLTVGCEEEANSKVHHQGVNCLECHSFSSAGTVYNNLRGKNSTSVGTANGYRIQLLLSNKRTIKYQKTIGYGNSLWKGDVGAVNDFTAQIIDANGKVVNSSKKNSHNVGRLACNSCHTQNGLNGAPGRLVNYAYNNSLAKKLQEK